MLLFKVTIKLKKSVVLTTERHGISRRSLMNGFYLKKIKLDRINRIIRIFSYPFSGRKWFNPIARGE